MKIEVPSYDAIKTLDFWVPPQAASLMLKIIDQQGALHQIDILPDDEAPDEVYPEDEALGADYPADSMRPRWVFINQHRMENGSDAELEVLKLLRHLFDNKQLGHPEGLAAIMAKEALKYFRFQK